MKFQKKIAKGIPKNNSEDILKEFPEKQQKIFQKNFRRTSQKNSEISKYWPKK